MKKNKKEIVFFTRKFILGLLVLISLATLFITYRLNLIPDKYLLTGFGVVVVLNALIALGLYKTKKNWPFKIMALLLSLAMLIGSLYAVKGTSFLGNITGADKNVHNVVMLVREDSEYQKVEEVKDLMFGANMEFDKESIDEALPLIEKKHGFTPNIDAYTKYDVLGQHLLDGTLEVILVSESNISTIDELVEGFESKTRILGMVSYEEDLGLEVPDVNVKKDTYSIFVTGIDTYGSIASVSRSDVNMIVTVSPSTGQILLTSIPRDYHVELGTKGRMDKLTHAGIYGVNESVTTLEKLLNIDIDYFLKVNFSSVENIVNALGGVDVYSEHSFTTLHGGYVINRGMNSLNGKQALGFVRERYSLPGGDNDRVKNQQELIKGVLNKAMSPKIITNFNGILNSVSGAMQMSIPGDKLSGIVKDQLNTGRSWEILQTSLTGTGSMSTTTYSMYGHNVYVMEPNFSSVNNASNMIHTLENGQKITN